MRKPDSANRVVTIAVACLATAMLMLDISVINTALSKIAHGLDTGLGGLQWVVDAYTIPLAATVLTAGAIADRFGRRRLFLLGVAIFTASSALCGAAGGIGVLVGARAIQGLGASIMFATALSLISQVTPRRKDRVNALAAYGAVIGASRRDLPGADLRLAGEGRRIAGHDVMDAGQRARRRRVDAADAPVRDRAAEDLAVEHAGQAQVVHILGAAGDLGAPFEARQRAADLARAGGHRAHAALPCASPKPRALRTARATNTRTNSFL